MDRLEQSTLDSSYAVWFIGPQLFQLSLSAYKLRQILKAIAKQYYSFDNFKQKGKDDLPFELIVVSFFDI